MPSIKSSIFIILIIFISINAKQIYMSEVYRHGARYSIHDYYDYNQTKQFAGQLTSIGLRQHFLLGSYIQNEYIKSKTPLLNITYNPRQTEFFSSISDNQRGKQSSYAQVLGMYPFGDGEKIPPNIISQLLEPPFQTIFPSSLKSQKAPQNYALQNGFQPIPIRPSSQFFPECPNINVILSRRGQLISKDLAQFQAQQSAFTDKMRLIFNLSMVQSNIANLQQLADTLISDKWLARDLPLDFTEADFRQIYFIRNYMLTNLYAGEVSQIVNAPFINNLLHSLEQKINDKLHIKKFSSISVQDTNIIPLLTFYNITSSDCLHRQFKNQTYTGNCADAIPYASDLIFELHQNDLNQNLYFVKVRYNGVYYKLFGKNTTEVEWSEFQTKSKANLKDFNTQCKVKTSSQYLFVAQ